MEDVEDTKETILFIEIWQEKPSLWDIKSSKYMDRTERERAMKRIQNELGLDAEKTKKKINSLRTYYKRELAKQQSSKTSGSSTDEVYQSKWAYFQLMHTFLHDQVKQRPSQSNIATSEDNEEETPSQGEGPRAKKICDRKSTSKSATENELLQQAINSLNADEGESEDVCFGKYVGKTLSGMKDRRVKLTARRNIENVLFEANMSDMHCQSFQNQTQSFNQYGQQIAMPQTPQCSGDFVYDNMTPVYTHM